MTDNRNLAIQYAHQNIEHFRQSLSDFIRIPSISTDPDHKEDMVLAANWMASQLEQLGMDHVQVFPTAGHPVVFGQSLEHPGRPTVLIYGHYDVQPADPLELWKTEPFDPNQRGENLHARGASDMKGQVVATLKAIESIQKTGDFPVNLKFVIEGEEEIGSPNFLAFLSEQKNLLAADIMLNPDTSMIDANTPTIIYATRGLIYFELRVYGPSHDLHSGMFGGVVHNPAQVLCELVAGMHDEQGRITLPGFYDSVLPLQPEERQDLSRVPLDDDYYKQQAGVSALWGEAGYTSLERIGARPSLDINGLYSGFTGVGSKTVLPAWAMAKLSMRLVPNQDPAEVEKQLTRYLKECAPHTVRWELIHLSGGYAAITDRNSMASNAMFKALETVWRKPPVFKREGGSITVVADLQRFLGVQSVLTGFGLLDDNIHAPNEKLHLPTWERGIDALIHFFYNLVD